MRPHFTHLSALAAITLLGALLRLWNLDIAQYRGDDVTVSGLALDIVRSGAFPTGVLSSVGIANGPTVPFVLAPPTLISSNHEWLSICVAILNIAMIPATYALARDLFGQRVALLAALLTAVNPWLVIYGRRLWLNAFIGPAAILFLWAFALACRSGRARWWALTGLAVSASSQIHLSCIPNLVAFASVLTFHRAFSLRKIAIGLACAAFLLIPWVVLSLLPDLSQFDWKSTRTIVPELTLGSLERATIVVTGVAYQSIAGQAGQMLDSTAAPFSIIDGVARVAAVAGWLFLGYVAWRDRRTAPARAAVALAMVITVATPTLLLLRPVQAGQLPYLYPYYFINLIPPLLIGIAAVSEPLARLVARSLPAAVSERSSHLVTHSGTALLAIIAGAQLLLAVPFFLTNDEFWPLGGYGVPWTYTDDLVRVASATARSSDSAILIGGDEDDSEQASVTARLLKRDFDLVRLFDSRDGIIFRDDDRPLVEVTTNEEHPQTQLLRHDFAARQIYEQVLPGAGWTRRVFEIMPGDFQRWASEHLSQATDRSVGGGIVYERLGVLPTGQPFASPHLGILWRLDSDPAEPFLTDIVWLDGDRVVTTDRHVAYPAAWWQRGDWSQTRMLNVFPVPAEVQLTERTAVEFTSRGVISGKLVGTAARIQLTAPAGGS